MRRKLQAFEKLLNFSADFRICGVLVNYTKGTNTPTLTPSHDFSFNLQLVFYTKLQL